MTISDEKTKRICCDKTCFKRTAKGNSSGLWERIKKVSWNFRNKRR